MTEFIQDYWPLLIVGYLVIVLLLVFVGGYYMKELGDWEGHPIDFEWLSGMSIIWPIWLMVAPFILAAYFPMRLIDRVMQWGEKLREKRNEN